mgnify:CR=1 FL=1
MKFFVKKGGREKKEEIDKEVNERKKGKEKRKKKIQTNGRVILSYWGLSDKN